MNMIIRISLIVLISSCISLFAENGEPTRLKFTWGGTSPIDLSLHPDFQQNEFMLGWQWGGSSRISKAELVKQKDMNA